MLYRASIVWVYFIAVIVLVSCDNKENYNNHQDHKGQHPSLILTKRGVHDIRERLGTLPILDASIESMQLFMDTEMKKGIQVPLPEHLSGGFTHEQHKLNFLLLHKAGTLYQIFGDETYADYAKQMFLEYAKLFPTLPLHPQERSYARGKLFWQCLNDANWLLYGAQAYDLIYNYLSTEERNFIEEKLLRPLADHISIDSPQFFNRIHNHSTWGTAAVGMLALVLDDEVLLDRALYGIKQDGIAAEERDDDGGFIKQENKAAGFLANLDESFSPDGYYTEGPYYQRYAMYPFLIFAQALQNKRPQLELFKYRDGVLVKAVETLINLSDESGNFFPLNDAQKGMSYYSKELVTAVDVAYAFGGYNSQLLDIAKKQSVVSLNDAGFKVALDMEQGKAETFIKKSIELRDGSNGEQGGLAVLRANGMELVFKYAAHGLSHGHFDRLGMSLYYQGEEVIQDYGLARFVNIEQKGGGNYLKENTTWAKQSIAHNTIVKNKTSHFKGSYKASSSSASDSFFYDSSKPQIKISSAKESRAYENTELQRTMALISDSLYGPLVIDVFRVMSQERSNYDLPFYYLGQPLTTNVEISSYDNIEVLGTDSGYEHLFRETQASMNEGVSSFNWMSHHKFYTLHMATSGNDELVFGRIGANDPQFNLRRDPVLIWTKKDERQSVFVSSIEAHGSYDPVTEIAKNATSNLEELKIITDTDLYTVVAFKYKDGRSFLLGFSNSKPGKEETHQLKLDGHNIAWVGPYFFNAL